MTTRNDFIEKLSAWLTPETCNALADYALNMLKIRCGKDGENNEQNI